LDNKTSLTQTNLAEIFGREVNSIIFFVERERERERENIY